jgi:hypothetical protein
VERLAEEAREDLRLGLLAPTAARALVQLPAGNHAEVLACARREGLTAAELRGVVTLVQAAADRPQVEHVLARPREALAQTHAGGVRPYDPRLSGAGNRVARHLGQLLEQLARMENWLRHRGRADLTPPDRRLLAARRGVRNQGNLPRLTVAQVLHWADAHHRLTGDWPKETGGPIPEALGEGWHAVDLALRAGVRGFPGGSSLARPLGARAGCRTSRAARR